jgi:AraC-like DNA-binding protein
MMPPFSPSDWIGELVGNVRFCELACGLSVVEEDELYTISSPFSRLLLGLAGRWTIRLPDRCVTLSRGQAVVIPTDVEATYQQKKGARVLWLYFRADYAGCIDIFRLVPPTRMSLPTDQSAATRFRQLIHGFTRQDLCGRLRSVSILIELLLPFLKGATPAASDVAAMQRLLPVLRYIDEHLGEEIHNDNLARLLYLSPKYFCNLFAELTGVPPVAYVNQRRVLRAKERLLLSGDAIKTIASQVGFSDPLYFTRVFRKLEGRSPQQYRERHRGAR